MVGDRVVGLDVGANETGEVGELGLAVKPLTVGALVDGALVGGFDGAKVLVLFEASITRI